MDRKRVVWAAPGDLNAFFGLMLDNIAGLVLAVSLLVANYEFPTDFALTHMVPGTAIGVLVGDLLFFVMALRYARRTGRSDVTAMPLGLDTPSTFGMVLFVLGPAFNKALGNGLSETDAAMQAWHVGICCIVVSGVFKFVCAIGSHWVRVMVPRAGLLGSLAAIAMVIIAFMPLIELLSSPMAGILALSIVLLTLVARRKFLGMPGALGAMVVGCAAFYAIELLNSQGVEWFGAVHRAPVSQAAFLPTAWLGAFNFQWWEAMPLARNYFPIVLPFALGTVIGGIDCTESAAAAGDEYSTGKVIGVEAFATLVAGMCGGVIQTTPYIGHPAYKAMGGRAAYTLATALFVGGAGLIGYFGLLYAFIPKATVYPILLFIGLEIGAQSFHATPKRHYPALGLACLPAMAALLSIFLGEALGGDTSSLTPVFAEKLTIITVLSSGFIVTSLLWASLLAAMIDGQLKRAGAFFLIAAACTAFGIIHSPLLGSAMYWPLQWSEGALRPAGAFVGDNGALIRGVFWGYVASGLILIVWNTISPATPHEESQAEQEH